MSLIYAVNEKLAHHFLSFFIPNIFYHCNKNVTWLSLPSVMQVTNCSSGGLNR